MFKRFLYTIGTMAMMLFVFAACQDHDVPSSPSQTDVPEGYVPINFRLDIPEMQEVQVRAVDPDGVDIHNVALYCFNKYGLYIGKEIAQTGETTSTSGTFGATIPEDTYIIHFLANQNTDLYDDDELRGKREEEVMAAMEGASGMLIFWGRFEFNENDQTNTTVQKQIEALSGNDGNGIQMIRNQAMITVDMTQPHGYGNNESFTVTGFRTANIHAFGTVAPFCPTHKFDITDWPCCDASFVTLPVNQTMMSDIIEVNTKAEDYVFEHENTLDNPVSVIIRGHHENETADKYYRVMLVDKEGNQLMVRRNHKYIIKIAGDLTYGQNSFAEALEGPATNNVWISVDAWVNEVSDTEFTLAVEKTSYVYEAEDVEVGQKIELKYTLSKIKNGTVVDKDEPEVTWLDGNTVAQSAFVHTFTPNGNVGNGSITITLRNMADGLPQHAGTLMIRKGRLYRTIEVVVIPTQQFTPSWISSQVYGNVTSDDNSRAHVTLKFTIPETCPESLYPFPVLISVNSLDVRSEAGDALPVVIKGDPQYFGTDYDGIEYKYVYTVNNPGVHRVYFENILSYDDEDQNQSVYLEANYFETLTKTVIYAEHNNYIVLPSLQTYINDNKSEDHPKDDAVYYKLVPQKRNALVDLNLTLMSGNSTLQVGNNDEFMLYSKTLDFVEGSNFAYRNIDDSHWSTNGRVQLFYPEDATPNSSGGYDLRLKTNASRSADLVRIASNTSLSVDRNGKPYTGRSYRDIIFELANYRPFGFAATVQTPVGTYGNANQKYEIDGTSSFVENVVPVELTYAPSQEVTVSFDVKSFISDFDKQEVSPFGEEFEIYIDAPMLELAEEQTGVVYKNGRFVYTVANDATNKRVEIKFKKKGICAVGDIVLSSNEEKVVFYKKTFHVTTQRMTGYIKYDDGTAQQDVPKDAFVAFIRTATNARIGVMTITADGRYSVNLRSEYVFNWTDEIELDYKVGESVYEYKTTLEKFFEASQNGTPIVLTEAVETTNP